LRKREVYEKGGERRVQAVGCREIGGGRETDKKEKGGVGFTYNKGPVPRGKKKDFVKGGRESQKSRGGNGRVRKPSKKQPMRDALERVRMDKRKRGGGSTGKRDSTRAIWYQRRSNTNGTIKKAIPTASEKESNPVRN